MQRLGRRQFLRLPQAGLATALAAALPAGACAQTTAALPALARGVNLSHWFEYDRNKGPNLAELRLLHEAGLDHVRVPVDAVLLGWDPRRGLQPAVAPLLEAVNRIAQAGLTAVVDLHLVHETKQLIEEERAAEPALVQLWQHLATALRGVSPAHLAFELFNEPQYYGLRGLRWPALQQRLLAAVRAVAPAHLVLLSGAKGGSFDGLQDLPLVDDHAVAYTFHFYDPFFFTHQGVPWLDPAHTAAQAWRQVRYPAAMARLGQPQAVGAHPRAHSELAQYLNEDWRAERILQALQPVGRWAQRHRVRVLCTEFGVFRQTPDAASRYRWLHDVRAGLQAQGMGWTVWDYSHHFAIAHSPAGLPRRLEPEAVKALGLRGAA